MQVILDKKTYGLPSRLGGTPEGTPGARLWYELSVDHANQKFGVEAVRSGGTIAVYEVYRQGGQRVRRDSALRREIVQGVTEFLSLSEKAQTGV